MIQKNNYRKYLWVLPLIVLLFEFVYATRQYNRTVIDGDFARIVLPDVWYERVLSDPLGLDALTKKEEYAATNRFSAHFVMRAYFYHVPLYLQKFVHPIESVYLSITIAKLIVHFIFLSMIGLYASYMAGFNFRKWLLGMMLVSPLLIAHGRFEYYLEFLDKTITYCMFYTLPICALLIYYFPVFRVSYIRKATIPFFAILLYLPATLFLVLFGPLTAPVVFLLNSILIFLIIIQYVGIRKNKSTTAYDLKQLVKRDFNMVIILLTGVMLSLYSIYLGSYNVENTTCHLSMIERYTALSKGFLSAFFNPKEGVLPILGALLLNLIVLRKKRNSGNLTKLYLIALFFILAYCVLLPLGGCRDYRPYILRRDTFLPILAVLLILFTISSMRLIDMLGNRKYLFFIPWLLLSCVYWKSDVMPPDYDDNKLEKKNLYQLSTSKESCTELIENCSVMDWIKFQNCEGSITNSKLIYHYTITDTVRYYKIRQ